MKRLLVLAALALPSLAGGQESCVPAEESRWASPLDRVVRVAAGTPVRDAIDRAGRQAGVTFAYSVDLLPAGTTTCSTSQGLRLGDALNLWLTGTTLEPVISGEDRVMLVPGRRRIAPIAPTGDSLLAAPAVLAAVRVEEAQRVPLIGNATAAHTVIDRAAIDEDCK